MGKPRKRAHKFDYNKNRRKAWKKKKQMPKVECTQMREAWDQHKSVAFNMKEMGLSYDPNKSLGIPKPIKHDVEVMDIEKIRPKKGKVIKDMEAIANAPQERRVRLSEPEVSFCVYMIEKYGDDYKAMARDYKNYYQDTPKQIRKKINTFKSIPEQYNEYLQGKTKSGMDTT